MKTNQIEKVVESHFVLPDNIRWYANAANFDLYYGPRPNCDDDEYPYINFSNATRVLSEWAEENLSEIWVDTNCDEIFTKEPEGEVDEFEDKEGNVRHEWIEPCWEDIRHYSYLEVKKIVFGKELGCYI